RAGLLQPADARRGVGRERRGGPACAPRRGGPGRRRRSYAAAAALRRGRARTHRGAVRRRDDRRAVRGRPGALGRAVRVGFRRASREGRRAPAGAPTQLRRGARRRARDVCRGAPGAAQRGGVRADPRPLRRRRRVARARRCAPRRRCRGRPLSGGARLISIIALALLALPALAHRLSPAWLGLTETEPGRYDVEWKVSVPGGLADVLEPGIPDGCRIDSRVRTYLVGDARLQHGTIVCDGGIAGRELAVRGLEATDTDVLVRIAFADGASFTHRLVPGAPAVSVPERSGVAAVVSTYLVLGVEHILLGIDHLLFVLALLLIVRGVGRLVATITAFTVAHSITLGAATLGVANVPSAPVEATIALSILFLATELA